jgi:prepilin-type N-terminal cleavage/methylation domain-containing protein
MPKRKGFTLVELLVVVAIIALLSTIGGLAWRAARNDAINSATRGDVIRLKEAIEKYYQTKGEYPYPSGCSPLASTATYTSITCTGDNGDKLSTLLVPQYIKELPKDKDGAYFQYNVSRAIASSNKVPTGIDGYAIRVVLTGSTICKTGRNMTDSWFFAIAKCDM